MIKMDMNKLQNYFKLWLSKMSYIGRERERVKLIKNGVGLIGISFNFNWFSTCYPSY